MEQRIEIEPIIGPRADVALMAGYYSPQIEVDVRLNTNEAPEPPPPDFLSRLQERLTEIDFNRYPEREANQLRQAIAKHHGVALNQVYCANGSNEILQSILLAYGGDGRFAAVFEPTYALHSHIAQVTGTSVVSGVRNSDFLIELTEFDRVVHECEVQSGSRPAVTFLCSPNNPTGRLEPFETITGVLERSSGLVIVDEAYGQFAPRSAIDLLAAHRNLLVVRTFSKTWSLAALRLGYVIADSEIIDALWRVTLPYHLDAIKQVAGELALEFESEMNDRVERIVAERVRLVGELKKLPLRVIPSDANFILFQLNGGDAKGAWQSLVDRSVLVRDISSLPRLAGFLRVTIGTSEENDLFLQALRDVLA